MQRSALVVIACLFFALSSSATDYYACDCGAGAEAGCTPGNDGAGLGTLASPWETYDRIQNQVATQVCGDTYNFCKGGVFNIVGSNEWLRSATDCRANPTIIKSYQPTGGSFVNKPHIEVVSATGVFNLSAGCPATCGHGVTIRDIKATCPGMGTTCGASSILLNIFAPAQAITVEDSDFRGFQTGINIGVDAQLILRRTLIQDMNTLGVVGQAGTGTIVEDNTFINNGCLDGAACDQERPLYLNCTTAAGCNTNRILTVRRNTFEDNTIDADGDAVNNVIAGVCNGNSVSLRGGFITFEDNTFTYSNPEASHLCLSARMGSLTASGAEQNCQDCVFRRNRIIGGHVGLITSSWVDAGDADAFGGVIENNLIVLPVKTGSSYLSNQAQTGIRNDEGVTGVDAVNQLIRNNSVIVGTPKTAAGSSCYEMQDNTGTFTVANNACRMLGTGTTDSCFRWFSIANFTDRTATDYNICHRSNGLASYALLNTARTLASVQGEGGANPTNEDHSQDGDPGFAGTAPDYDLTIQASDLAVNTGNPANFAPLDYLSSVRPHGSAPDVGAYEFGFEILLPSSQWKSKCNEAEFATALTTGQFACLDPSTELSGTLGVGNCDTFDVFYWTDRNADTGASTNSVQIKNCNTQTASASACPAIYGETLTGIYPDEAIYGAAGSYIFSDFDAAINGDPRVLVKCNGSH